VSVLAFELSPGLEATEPPEARGIARDEVRLLVARGTDCEIEHARFTDLVEALDPGDLLVVNVSRTMPAAVPAQRGRGGRARVHFATAVPDLDDRWWVVELRSADGSEPRSGEPGELIKLDGGPESLELVAPYGTGARLMLARLHATEPVPAYLERHGEPIRYGYVRSAWPLQAYQNIYATVSGSAEMPSAGRPFSRRLITALAGRGVLIAPLTLHTGVSSPERHEPPFPERFDVPESTALLIEAVRGSGGRVIAVGTTVVRALETVAAGGGALAGGSGWTGLVIDPEHEMLAVDGLITGWHEPEASHLMMLSALAGEGLLDRSYTEALEHGYLWHEFGDSHLILP
jgi:S-adenosylmethionine:tRNA-ribosyltransferase-isomerase (queuine synthetase)